MNLLPSFSKSALLEALPPLDFCEFKGETPAGFQRFECKREDDSFSLLTVVLIRKEEDLIWKSCDELLSRTSKEAAAMLQGFFGFQLLSLQLGDSVRSFQWDHLRQLLVNHARQLKTGEEKLIQYTSLFGILKKRIPESWGKIEYQAPVTVYRKPAAELDLLVKKLLKEGETLGGKYEIILHDLSADPIFRFGEEDQTSRMEKLLKTFKPEKELPQISILDARGFTELGFQFGFRDDV